MINPNIKNVEMPALVNLQSRADSSEAQWVAKMMLPLLIAWAKNGPYQTGDACCALCGSCGVIESLHGHYADCLWKETVEFVEAMSAAHWESELSDWERSRDWNSTLKSGRLRKAMGANQ